MSNINIVLVDIDSNVDISIDPNILYVHSEWYFYWYLYSYFIIWHFGHTDRELQMPHKKQEMDKHQNQHVFRLYRGDVNNEASPYYLFYKQ